MAKQTWDKAIHAAPTINHKLTQDDWHFINRTTVPVDPNAPAPDPETRVYNPSGPFYFTRSPHVHTAPPDPPAPPADQLTPFSKETK